MSADPLSNPKNFLFKTWRTFNLPDPTPLQYDFIEYANDHRAWAQVQEEAKKELLAGTSLTGARKILMAFRGAAKTYVVTTNSVYRLRENPEQEEVLVVSATDGFAGGISVMAYNMVTQFDWLQADLAPSKDQPASSLAFDVRGRIATKDRSFTARGIFGQITGLRATLILGDDLETPNTSETETKRTNLRHRMGELGGAIIKPGGDILMMGTAHAEQTVYKEYADEKGYELRIYPIVYPTEKEQGKVGARMAPMLKKALEANPLLAGTSTEPSRFTERDIMGRQTEYGRTEFERQFKMWLDAGSDRLYPLKLRDLVVIDITPPSPATGGKVLLPTVLAWTTMRDRRVREVELDSLTGDGALFYSLTQDIFLPAEQVICRIDPSGAGTDETSWSILAGLGGRVYLLAQGSRLEGHTEDTLKAIAADCALWGVQLVQVESNFGQGMFSSLLTPHLKTAGAVASVEDVNSGQTQKERRIVETLEPVVTSHRLIVNSEVFRKDFHIDYKAVEENKRRFYRLSYQFTRITRQKDALKHDDRVDSLAGGVSHFVDRMKRALKEEESLSKDEALQREAEKIIQARQAAGLPVVGLLPDTSTVAREKGHVKETR